MAAGEVGQIVRAGVMLRFRRGNSVAATGVLPVSEQALQPDTVDVSRRLQVKHVRVKRTTLAAVQSARGSQ